MATAILVPQKRMDHPLVRLIASYVGGMEGMTILLMQKRTESDGQNSIDEALATVGEHIDKCVRKSELKENQGFAGRAMHQILIWFWEGAKTDLTLETPTPGHRRLVHQVATALGISSRRRPTTNYVGACELDQFDGHFKRCRRYDHCVCPKYKTEFTHVDLARAGTFLPLTTTNRKQRIQKTQQIPMHEPKNMRQAKFTERYKRDLAGKTLTPRAKEIQDLLVK